MGAAPGPQQPPIGMPQHLGQQQFQSRPPAQQGPYPGQNMPQMPQYQVSIHR